MYTFPYEKVLHCTAWSYFAACRVLCIPGNTTPRQATHYSWHLLFLVCRTAPVLGTSRVLIDGQPDMHINIVSTLQTAHVHLHVALSSSLSRL